MECYYNSNPEVVGYIERECIKKGMLDVKDQRLLDQKWQILTKKWFSALELNEIKERSMGVTEDSFGFREDDMDVVCENVCYVMLEDTCLNQDRYSNNNESEVVFQKMKMKYSNNSLYLYIRKKRNN